LQEGGIKVSEKKNGNRLPVLLLTGFLGAGKSTLINRIIHEYAEARIGLVVNEFGSVPIESAILQAEQDEVIELSGGCMCCVRRKDLYHSVTKLLRSSRELTHIIIEASGLSDPVPIIETVRKGKLGKSVFLEKVLCVVDAKNYNNYTKEYSIAVDQIKFADYALVTKADKKEDMDLVREYIHSVVPETKVFSLDDGFNLETLFAGASIDPVHGIKIMHSLQSTPGSVLRTGTGRNHEKHSVHAGTVTTVLFESDKEISVEKFRDFLSALPEGIIRAKGYIRFDTPERDRVKYILQCACSRKEIESSRWRKNEARRSVIVFIGRLYDPDRLMNDLKNCEVDAG
jgi:G3E family GTPase